MMRFHDYWMSQAGWPQGWLLGLLLLLPAGNALADSPLADSPNDADTQAAIEAIRGLEPIGVGNERAQDAVQTLAGGDTETLFAVLDAMRDSSPIAKNWLRGIASELAQTTTPSSARLLTFFNDRQHDPDSRYLVYRWLTFDNAELQASLLQAAVDDPSLPLRYLAIAKQIEAAEALQTDSPAQSRETFLAALNNARNPEQLKSIAESLKELGAEISLAQQLGMFTNWSLIAPFDNANGAGFDRVFEVEESLLVDGVDSFDLETKYETKDGTATWVPGSTEDAMGELDLNPIFANEKEAVAYALCKFTTDQPRVAEARIGSINANKVWVNGELVTTNEVYHSGSMIDQYIGNCKLVAGENWVLIKICQNNQTESWAQDWQFQFRLTDSSGKQIDLEIQQP